MSALVVLAGVFLGHFLHVEDVSPALEIRSLYSTDRHYIVMNNVIIHACRPNTPSPVYDRESLLSLRGREVIDPTLKAFIDRTVVLKFKPSSKHRCRRGGARVQRRIQTVSRGQITRCKHRSHQTTDEYSTNQQPTMSPLIYPSVRRTLPPGRKLHLGALNIQSVNNKIDDIQEIMDTHQFDVLALTETWHEDSNCVPIKRLRSMRFNVLEAARPITTVKTRNKVAFVNHGGIAVLSRPGIAVANVKMVFSASSFEYLCCRIISKGASTILATVYRPGSAEPSVNFFKEFTSLIDV